MEEKQGNGFTFKDKECCVQDEQVNKAGHEEQQPMVKKAPLKIV